MFDTVDSFAEPGIAIHDKAIIFERAHVGEAGEICGNLRADAVTEPRIVRLEDRPTRCMINCADYFQTEPANREARKFAMRFAAATHGDRSLNASPACRTSCDDIQAFSRQCMRITVVDIKGSNQVTCESHALLIQFVPGPIGSIKFAEQPC